MPKRIEKLTEVQELMMPEWAEKWIKIGLQTGEADWGTFNKYMSICYIKSRLKYPKRVIRVPSPFFGAHVARVAAAIWNKRYKNRNASVGASVGASVRNSVGDSVRNSVRASVNASVDASVNASVRDSVGASVRDSVQYEIQIVSTVEKILKENNLKKSDAAWNYWLGGQFWVGGWWWGSPAYVSFFTDVCGLKLEQDIAERAEAYRKVCESVNYIWPNRDFILVCERPTKIVRNATGKLHNEYGKAIEYPDGWGLYCLYGIVFEQEMWTKIIGQKLTFAEILKIEDIDKRMVALRYCKPYKLFEGTKAELVFSKSVRGNELWKIPASSGIFTQDEYFLHYYCPSSGREYIKGVDPVQAKHYDYNGDSLMAISHNFTLAEYMDKNFVDA